MTSARGSAIAAVGGIAAVALLIALTGNVERPGPSPPPAPTPTGSPASSPSAAASARPTPPPGFPTGEFRLEVRAADDPPTLRYVGAPSLELRPDGTYTVFARIDEMGWFVVRGPAVDFHADACPAETAIGRYWWAAGATGTLRLTVRRGGDPCGDRAWLLTLRPWQPVDD